MTHDTLELITRKKRGEIIALNIRKAKFLEDKNNDSIREIEEQYKKALDEYLIFAKQSLSNKYRKSKIQFYQEINIFL